MFSIGKAGRVPKTVAQLTAQDKVGRPTQIGFGIARGLSYAAIAFADRRARVPDLDLAARPRLGGRRRDALAEASERFSRRLRRAASSLRSPRAS